MKHTRTLFFALALLLSAPVQTFAQEVEQPQIVRTQSPSLAVVLAQLTEIAASAGVPLPEALQSLLASPWSPEEAQQQFEAAAAALERLAADQDLSESAVALIADLKQVLEQTYAQLIAYESDDEQESTSKKAKEVFCTVFIKNLLNVCGNLFVNGKVTINARNGNTNPVVLEVNGNTTIDGTLTVNNLIVVNSESNGDGEFDNLVVNDTITVASFDNGVVQSDANGLLFSSTNITEAEQLSLPQTISNTVGVININGTPVLHAYDDQNNIFVGSNAGNFTTTGTNLTTVGAFALNSNTTGGNNTAVGFSALFDNTTGVANTGVGYFALRDLDGGNSNTALGNLALSGNSTFSNSTALGAEAGRSQTGDNITAVGFQALAVNQVAGNVAVGYQALAENTTGLTNTAVGFQALAVNTVEGGNVAVGFQALAANTGGNNNTAVGSAALDANTLGDRNTAVGNAALGANTTGVSNVGIGQSALAANQSGDNNIAIGDGALLNLVSGQGNIAIGDDAGLAYNGAQTNNIVIGTNGDSADSNTIRIGNVTAPNQHTRNFQAGIRGVTTTINDALAVLVDSAGQLGTLSSSRRFKENIKSVDATLVDKLMQLRPVEYNYIADEQKQLDWGLIAEEVAEILPRLVVNDAQGQPLTVRYHVLPAMLLYMIQQLSKRVDDLTAQLGTTA